MLLLVVFMLQGCTKRVSEPRREDIAEKFPAVPESSNVAPSDSEMDLFLDGSLSMQGFVQQGTPGHYAPSSRSSYYIHLDRLLNNFARHPSPHQCFKFTNTLEKCPDLMSSALLPGFYNGKDTPLARLLGERILPNPTHTAIVVSDMVQSDSGEDPQQLTKELAALGTQRPQMRLFGFKSDFYGTYFSERPPKSKYPMAKSQDAGSDGRPFYILVIAPSAAAMDEAQKRILSGVGTPYVFDPTAPALRVTGMELSEGQDKTWQVWNKLTPEKGDVQRFTVGFKLLKPSGDGTKQQLGLDVRYAENIPFNGPPRLRFETTKDEWADKGFALPKPAHFDLRNEAPESYQADPGLAASPQQQRVMHLVFAVPQSAAGTTDVYHLLVKPALASLQVPDWISQWDTDDDSSGGNGNKTFRLKRLADTMKDSIAEQNLFGDWIFTILRKD